MGNQRNAIARGLREIAEIAGDWVGDSVDWIRAREESG
jgi:hypothetical protein